MGRIIYAFLLIVILASAYFVLKDEDIALSSPIPQIFGKSDEKKIEVENGWFPNKENGWTNKNSHDLYISAKSALVVDYETGEIIFAKNADSKLPTASTIKIMTALVALASSNLDQKFTVSQNAATIGEDSMGLTEGEILTLKEILYGLMLVSGNDAAITTAEGVAGSEEEFVEIMNNKLKSLGLSDTKFVNATGLDEDDKKQYSTVTDLAVIAHFIWEKYPEFRKIASTDYIFIEYSSDHKAFELYNDTNLLTTYPGVRGIKPGFTWNAGLCLVTYAENEGKKLLSIILGSEDRRGEMILLLDYGFSNSGIDINRSGLD